LRIVDLEVAGSNPVSHPQRKSLQPKRFTLTPGCPGARLRTTGTVESFHSSAETRPDARSPQVRPLVSAPPPLRPRPRRLDRPDRHPAAEASPWPVQLVRVPHRVRPVATGDRNRAAAVAGC